MRKPIISTSSKFEGGKKVMGFEAIMAQILIGSISSLSIVLSIKLHIYSKLIYVMNKSPPKCAAL